MDGGLISPVGLVLVMMVVTTLLTIFSAKKWPLWSRLRVCLFAVLPVPFVLFSFACAMAALYLPPSIGETDYGPSMFVGLVIIGAVVPLIWLTIAPVFSILTFELLGRK
jgi:hypothetical protein